MKVKDIREEWLDIIASRFCNMSAIEMTEDNKKELRSMLNGLLEKYHGHVIHFGIQISASENFFRDAESVLKAWLGGKVFSDRKVFFVVACEIAEFFLDKERVRDFAFIEHAGSGKTVYHPNEHHISCCEREAGDMMLNLGFLEKALGFYRQAISTGNSSGAENSMYRLALIYRKSGQKIDEIDKMINEVIRNVVNYAMSRVRDLVTSYERYWDRPIEEAKKSLMELGCEETKQFQKLQTVYETVISTLLKMREKSITFDNKYRSKPIDFEESGFCADYLAEMHRLVGDKQGAIKWEKIYSTAKVF